MIVVLKSEPDSGETESTSAPADTAARTPAETTTTAPAETTTTAPAAAPGSEPPAEGSFEEPIDESEATTPDSMASEPEGAVTESTEVAEAAAAVEGAEVVPLSDSTMLVMADPDMTALAALTLAAVEKVLILGSTVSGGSSSLEAAAAMVLGFDVEVVDDATWGR